ncbi:MAG: sodium-dependent transporter, partial [Nitrospiria bacterium]
YGADRLREYINSVSQWKLGRWWNHAIKWVIPGALGILVAQQFATEWKGNYEGYPDWAIMVGWATVMIPVIIAIGLALKPKTTQVHSSKVHGSRLE